MTASDNTIPAERLSAFSNNLLRKGLNTSKKVGRKVLNNPGRTLDITGNVAIAVASRSPKTAL